MLHLSVRLVFFFLSIATLGFSFERLTRVMASASVGLALGPGAALANEKTDFVKAASSGASIQTQLEKNIDKEKAVERSDFTEITGLLFTLFRRVKGQCVPDSKISVVQIRFWLARTALKDRKVACKPSA